MKSVPTTGFAFPTGIAPNRADSPLIIRRGMRVILGMITWFVLSPDIKACPFCSAQGNTLLQEITAASRAVVAQATSSFVFDPLATVTDEVQSTERLATFKVTEVMAGDSPVGEVISLPMLESWDANDACLVFAFEEDQGLEWTAPQKLTREGCRYLQTLMAHRTDAEARLGALITWLDETDPMIANDVYGEFAQASYAQLFGQRSRLDRVWLKEKIASVKTKPERRRLYWTLLGICGETEDIAWIEGFLTQHRHATELDIGLDAAAGCYLTLAKESGMAYLETEYLKASEIDFTEVNAIIQAIRFHLVETDAVPRERLAAGLKCVLKEPALADLVIPDLARLEDWTVVEEMVELFRKGKECPSVRVQAIRYLQMCPLDVAKSQLEVCQEMDPAAFRRARILSITPRATIPAVFSTP